MENIKSSLSDRCKMYTVQLVGVEYTKKCISYILLTSYPLDLEQ